MFFEWKIKNLPATSFFFFTSWNDFRGDQHNIWVQILMTEFVTTSISPFFLMQRNKNTFIKFTERATPNHTPPSSHVQEFSSPDFFFTVKFECVPLVSSRHQIFALYLGQMRPSTLAKRVRPPFFFFLKYISPKVSPFGNQLREEQKNRVKLFEKKKNETVNRQAQ